jgi:hypothetical protein
MSRLEKDFLQPIHGDNFWLNVLKMRRNKEDDQLSLC